MNKTSFMKLMAVGLLACGFIPREEKISGVSHLTLANIEGLAAGEGSESTTEGWNGSWWDRPDYKCVKVECAMPFNPYPSTVSAYVGEGKGSVAHSWNCTGCGDYGWRVIE